jgi:hypothetical protein
MEKGTHHSKETLQKMSRIRKGRPNEGWFEIGHKRGMTGKHHLEKTKIKIRLSNKIKGVNHKGNPEVLKKWRENGGKVWNKGLKGFMKGRIAKERNPNWKGGISYNPYPEDWTDILKRAIRKRDNYTCQICGKEPAICVHHIDYDKENCNLDNLITLCSSCHMKTSFKRNYWRQYFKK